MPSLDQTGNVGIWFIANPYSRCSESKHYTSGWIGQRKICPTNPRVNALRLSCKSRKAREPSKYGATRIRRIRFARA